MQDVRCSFIQGSMQTDAFETDHKSAQRQVTSRVQDRQIFEMPRSERNRKTIGRQKQPQVQESVAAPGGARSGSGEDIDCDNLHEKFRKFIEEIRNSEHLSKFSSDDAVEKLYYVALSHCELLWLFVY